MREAQGFSPHPIVEMMIPSVVDDSLAPKGAHVASLFCQQFKPEADWDALKERAVQAVFDVVQSHCPNFRASLLGYRALTPLDLEREFGLVGRRHLPRPAFARPVVFAAASARLRALSWPVARLYHCGSGAHPGGGVTGAPGHNAATEIKRDLA